MTLTADTTVVLPSDSSIYTLGSGGTFDQLDVSGGTMTFTMSGGEAVTITAPSQLALTNDGGFSYTCAAQSTLTLNPAASATISVTPGSACSSGGGRTSTYTLPPVVVRGLTASQIQAILSLLASFKADQAVIDNVSAALHGTAPSAAPAAGIPSFTRDLTLNSTGADVKALQVYLNAHGYPVAASGPGSPGQETTRFGTLTKAALARFQAAAGITPAAGYFGPKTRAYAVAHP